MGRTSQIIVTSVIATTLFALLVHPAIISLEAPPQLKLQHHLLQQVVLALAFTSTILLICISAAFMSRVVEVESGDPLSRICSLRC